MFAKRLKPLILPLALSPLMAGCAAPLEPIGVTRFHDEAHEFTMEQTIAVMPAPGEQDSLELAPYIAAVRTVLQREGYAATNAGQYRVEVRMRRDIWQPGKDRNPVSVGVGGSTGSYGSGLGVGVGIDLSGPPPEQATTQLSVVIRDIATGLSIWEGRANQRVPRKSPLAMPETSARLLADALFMDFPGENGESFTVKQK